jgi:hypothetical protein
VKMKRRDFLVTSAGLAGGFLPQILRADGKPCPPVSLSVAQGASVTAPCIESVLGRIAQRLAAASPSAPAWSDAEIGLSSLNSNIHHWGELAAGETVVGGRPPFTAANAISDQYNILDWPGKALWDPTRGDWWYSGGPTGNQDPASPTIVRYRPSDDRFVHWQGPTSMQGGIWSPSGHAHSFDAADLDVAGRKIWRHLAPHNSESYNFKLGWFDIDTFRSGRVEGDGYAKDNYPTISFLPDNRLLHLVRPQPGNAANIRRFEVDTQQWVEPLSGPQGNAGPSCYFDGRIYVTTDNGDFYAILPDGKLEPRAPTPITMDRSVSAKSTYGIFCPLGEFLYAFCGNGDIWRYDPDADNWGTSPYHRIPWLWPHDQFSESWHFISEATVGPIPNEGVALLCVPVRFHKDGTTPSRAVLWKP